MTIRRVLMPLLLLVLPGWAAGAEPVFVAWQMSAYSIDTPLGNLRGDAARGREVVRDRSRGNCLACHRMPIPEEDFHGTVGPPLDVVATRLNAGQLRLRVADQQRINPNTIMPSYHRDPRSLNRLDDDHWDKPVLSAQEVEDVVAYLLTLKGDAP